MAQTNSQSNIVADRLFFAAKRILHLASEPVHEIFYGLRFKTIPWQHCLVPGLLFNGMVLLEVDLWLLKSLGALFLYPKAGLPFLVYVSVGAFSGFLSWGLWQTGLKQKLVQKLTEAFLVSGLKTPLGKMPSFIFDKPIDALTRKMRLKRQHLTLKQFNDAKESLEGSLQIYIDNISENREKGSIDLVYSHSPMQDIVTLGNAIQYLPRDTFIIGRSRSTEITTNLAKTPHFLIGGQTGGGKSTFLRQVITSLHLNNKDYQFKLIDLKGGLEFQIFENKKRIKVVPDVEKAIPLIQNLSKSLKYRMELLKLNKCKDIDAYFSKPSSDRIYPRGNYSEQISRTVVVIDEVADLFMANSEMKSKQVQEAKRVIWKIGAQGRAVGIHLIVATQRPDVKALDSQVKTHLVGVVCFPMVNDASSMTVLGSGRATDLPRIPGRAIWKAGMEMIELQTPFLKPEEVTELLKESDTETQTDSEDKDEESNSGSGNATAEVPVDVENRDDQRASDEVFLGIETN